MESGAAKNYLDLLCLPLTSSQSQLPHLVTLEHRMIYAIDSCLRKGGLSSIPIGALSPIYRYGPPPSSLSPIQSLTPLVLYLEFQIHLKRAFLELA
jgi:hypothetical protein